MCILSLIWPITINHPRMNAFSVHVVLMRGIRTLKRVHIGWTTRMQGVRVVAPISRHHQIPHHWSLTKLRIRTAEFIVVVSIFTRAPPEIHAFNSKLYVSFITNFPASKTIAKHFCYMILVFFSLFFFSILNKFSIALFKSSLNCFFVLFLRLCNS